MREEEEKEAERRRWKEKKRHRDHKIKLAKQIQKGHWSVRYIDEDRKNQILKEARGEEEGKNNVVVKQEIIRRPHKEVEEEGSLATMRTGDTRRKSSMVDSTSVWSGTSTDSSSWYCGQDIHTRASLYSYDVDEGEGDEDGGRSGRSSGASSDTTTINMDQ